jgi:ribosomal protein S18 acetylase RimI-like enzyme
MSHLIQLMQGSSIAAASESLADAFMKDPLQTYVFPIEEERKRKSPEHFAAILRYGLMYGEVYTTNNSKGAVVWLRPGETDVTSDKAEKGGLGKLPEVLGEEPTKRFFSVLDFLEPYHKRDANESHWYTMVIGVAPSDHGTGMGRSLMKPVIDKARSKQTPIYLETAEPSNISFYTKLGFSVIRELTEPDSGLKLWTFSLDF